LPVEIRAHLRKRLRERSATEGQVQQLIEWTLTQPDAPDGDWYKDFGSFKLCGTGPYPKTILTEAMRPYGRKID
jgi:hypothetical protein